MFSTFHLRLLWLHFRSTQSLELVNKPCVCFLQSWSHKHFVLIEAIHLIRHFKQVVYHRMLMLFRHQYLFIYLSLTLENISLHFTSTVYFKTNSMWHMSLHSSKLLELCYKIAHTRKKCTTKKKNFCLTFSCLFQNYNWQCVNKHGSLTKLKQSEDTHTHTHKSKHYTHFVVTKSKIFPC